jgi:hypothetical protein
VIPVAVSTVPPLGDWLIGPLRPCEWALLVWLVLAPAIGRRLGLARFSLPLLLLLLVHLLAEGWRWQMAPLYAAAPAMLLWVAVPAWPRFVAWLAGVIGPAAGVAALVLAVLVPIFYLPPARGSAAVGTRLDRLPGPDGTGDIYLQTWYPADLDHAKIAAYRGQSDRLLLSYQRLVPTGAGAEAPPVADIPPLHVVLLVHGLGGSRAQNTSLALDLASQGYLVAAYDRPDGTDPGVAIDLSSDAGRLKTLATGAAGTAAGAADASYVLDALGHLGAPFFAGRVATDRAVIIGYSFGGSIAAEACRRDHRFVAVMNMDGWLFNSARGQGVPCPYVLMNDGEGTQLRALRRLGSDDHRRLPYRILRRGVLCSARPDRQRAAGPCPGLDADLCRSPLHSRLHRPDGTGPRRGPAGLSRAAVPAPAAGQ